MYVLLLKTIVYCDFLTTNNDTIMILSHKLYIYIVSEVASMVFLLCLKLTAYR